MMAHPQSSPRGLFAKDQVRVGTTRILKTTTSLPGDDDQGVAFRLMLDSTGSTIVVNTTSTTWRYVSLTSVRADST
jgi:hypothetical protein